VVPKKISDSRDLVDGEGLLQIDHMLAVGHCSASWLRFIDHCEKGRNEGNARDIAPSDQAFLARIIYMQGKIRR